MRTSSMLVILVGGCGAIDGDVAHQICRASSGPVEVTAFRALTATSWYDSGACNSGDRLPPTCNRLELASDGGYTWTAFSDYPERDQHGTWNLHARDATSGLVCLDNGSVVDFALDGDLLHWGPLGLDPDARRSPGGSPDALPTLAVDPMFVALTANAWVKTDGEGLYYLPTSFTLSHEGTFEAEFRGGECTAVGSFSLIREPYGQTTRFMLWSRPEPNRCDSRDGGTPAFNLGDTPQVADGVLTLFTATYASAP